MLSFSIDPNLRHRTIEPKGSQYEESVVSSIILLLPIPPLTPSYKRGHLANCEHIRPTTMYDQIQTFPARMESRGAVIRPADLVFQGIGTDKSNYPTTWNGTS